MKGLLGALPYSSQMLREALATDLAKSKAEGEELAAKCKHLEDLSCFALVMHGVLVASNTLCPLGLNRAQEELEGLRALFEELGLGGPMLRLNSGCSESPYTLHSRYAHPPWSPEDDVGPELAARQQQSAVQIRIPK